MQNLSERNIRKTIAAFFLLIIILITLPVMAEESSVVSLDIASINDFHGMIKESKANPGLAKLSAMIKSLRDGNPQGFVFVAAGDLYQGSMESNMVRGKSVIEVLNYLQLDATAIGNHEFDWSPAVLKQMEGWSNYPYLACNIFYKKNGRFAEDIAKEYVIIERQGVKIALVGMATTDTAVTSAPQDVAEYTFANPQRRANELSAELRKQGVDLIVFIAHMAIYPTNYADADNSEISGDGVELVNAAKDADVAVTGHSHTVINQEINNIPTIQAECYGRRVGIVHLDYDKENRKIISRSSKIIDTQAIKAMTADAGAEAILQAELESVAKISEEVIASSTVMIKCYPKEQQQSISLMGQYIADNMRKATGADIAMQNAGGVRACNYDVGNITVGMLYGILPFDNTLVTVELTGREIMEALQYGICNEKYGTVQYSGLKVIYDKEKKQIVSAKTADSKDLLPDKIYKVVVNDFVADGGDGWAIFAKAKNHHATGIVLRSLITDALRKDKVFDVRADERLIFVNEAAAEKKAA